MTKIRSPWRMPGLVLGGDRAEEIRLQRKRLTPEAIDEFDRCCRRLDRQPRTVNVNRRTGTSYGLKDEVEAESGYVSNGMFIAAALACGHLIQTSRATGFRTNRCLFELVTKR